MNQVKGRSERVRRALELLGVKPVDKSTAREEIDKFFVKEMVPRLSAISRKGHLPDLATDPAWSEAVKRWDTLAEDCETPAAVEQIKTAMVAAVASYEEVV